MSKRKIKKRGIPKSDVAREQKYVRMNVQGIINILRKAKEEKEQNNVAEDQKREQEESSVRDESGAAGAE
jgi:hypothetical protein